MWSIKKISNHDAIAYIVVQVIGALAAMFISQSLTNGVVNPLVENSFTVGAAEAIGAFILVFGISAVVAEQVKPAASGLVIGGSLLLGILVTSGLSNGVLNPAVAIGLNSISAMYLIAPIIGSLGAVWAYRYLNK
jgi:glycerol uptake facilitator-like aquaporin